MIQLSMQYYILHAILPKTFDNGKLDIVLDVSIDLNYILVP